MELTEAFRRRKSVRSYTGEPITEEQLHHILQAAWAAPVGGARYNTVHMTIVKNKDMLEKIDRYAADKMGNPQYHPLYGAPLLIIFSIKDPGNEKVTAADVGCILQNMALAATEEGVGHCDIYGATVMLDQNEELKRELGIPEGYTALGSMILGQTNEKYEVRDIPEHRFGGENTIE